MTFAQTFDGIDTVLLGVLGDVGSLDVNNNGVTVLTVKGLFEAPWLEPQLGQLRTRILEPQFRGKTADLSSAVKGTSKLTVNGLAYTVIDTEPGGTGITTLVLRPNS